MSLHPNYLLSLLFTIKLKMASVGMSSDERLEILLEVCEKIFTADLRESNNNSDSEDEGHVCH